MQFLRIRHLTFLILLCAQVCFMITATSTEDSKIEDNLKEQKADDTDDDYVDETEGELGKQTPKRDHNTLNRVGVTYSWDRWDKWSKCGTSCVQIKKRKCIERTQNDTLAPSTQRVFYPSGGANFGCFGILKRYRLCKDERCRVSNSNQSFRDDQCISLNNGRHNWVGYQNELDQCALYCRQNESSGLTLPISMNMSVTDGTSCNRPSIYYTHNYRRQAVCVEGICRAVHTTSGFIRPSTTRDSQLKCGSVLCKPVAERFNKSELSEGYNYITTLPMGAMSIDIKKDALSRNVLALKNIGTIKSFYGNKTTSDIEVIEISNSKFTYNRTMGSLLSKGPLILPLDLMLLVIDGNASEVQYNYTLPTPSAPVLEEEEVQMFWDELGRTINETDEDATTGATSRLKERRRRKFSWKLLGFGECSRTCGPGTQTPIFRCIREAPTRYYSPSRCAALEKPTFSEDIYHCNRGLCAAFWKPSNFSDCKCSNGSAPGVRSRIFHCMQEQFKGDIIEVSDKLCSKRNDTTESCSCQSLTADEQQPQALARQLRTPQLRVPLKRNQRNSLSNRSGVWLMSDWWGDCSIKACQSDAFQYRSIYCERTPPRGELCDLSATPEQKRSCSRPKSDTCNTGIWLTSEWSTCTGDCFNLQRLRTVVCLSNGIVVDETRCDISSKPSIWRRCMLNEAEYCGPRWHYSNWSQCSRSCGAGVKRRQAKCLDYDWKQGALVASTDCIFELRELIHETCNLDQCSESPRDYVNNEDQANNELDYTADCTDRFSNCERILRQNVCHLKYYQTYCCRSCQGYHKSRE